MSKKRYSRDPFDWTWMMVDTMTRLLFLANLGSFKNLELQKQSRLLRVRVYFGFMFFSAIHGHDPTCSPSAPKCLSWSCCPTHPYPDTQIRESSFQIGIGHRQGRDWRLSEFGWLFDAVQSPGRISRERVESTGKRCRNASLACLGSFGASVMSHWAWTWFITRAFFWFWRIVIFFL